jgi:hypothetical protein
MYAKLRDQALTAGIRGAVIDVPVDDGWITFVSMGDDTTSMYTSVGGGTIGAGEHAPVAAATQKLLTTIDEHLDQFEESDDTGHPGHETVRVFALIPDGSRRVADAPEDAFWARTDHELTSVLMAVQDVVTAIREVPQPS